MTDLNEAIEEELDRARKNFPSPDLLLTAFSEEYGEVVKAILNYKHGAGSLLKVRKEMVQTMAMANRLLKE